MYGKDLSIFELPTSNELIKNDYFVISKDIQTRRVSNKISYASILERLKSDIVINENTSKLVNEYVINNKLLDNQKDFNTEILRIVDKLDKSKLIFYHHEVDLVNPTTTIQEVDGVKIYSKLDKKFYVIKNQRYVEYPLSKETLYINIFNLDDVVFKQYTEIDGLVPLNFNFENKNYVRKNGTNVVLSDFKLNTDMSIIHFNDGQHGFYSHVNSKDYIKINTNKQEFSFVNNTIQYQKINTFSSNLFKIGSKNLEIKTLNQKYLDEFTSLNHPSVINAPYSVKIDDKYEFANDYGSIDLTKYLSEFSFENKIKLINDYSGIGVNIITQEDLNKKIVNILTELRVNRTFINESTTPPTTIILNLTYPNLNPGDSIYYVNLSLPKKYVYLGKKEFSQEIFTKMT